MYGPSPPGIEARGHGYWVQPIENGSNSVVGILIVQSLMKLHLCFLFYMVDSLPYVTSEL
jgi:hypothetical protein